MEECFIVGGGPSLYNFGFHTLKDRDTIAVNQAIFRLPTAKYFLTMDYTWLRKGRIVNPVGRKLPNWNQFTSHPAEKVFVLAFSEPRLQQIDDTHFIDTEHKMQYDLSLFDRIVRAFKYGDGIGTSFEDFRCGSDSGFSALQLAVVEGYKKIYLLGFDFVAYPKMTHYHTDYQSKDYKELQEKLDLYVKAYVSGLQAIRDLGIQVFSCSPISKLNKYLIHTNIESVL